MNIRPLNVRIVTSKPLFPGFSRGENRLDKKIIKDVVKELEIRNKPQDVPTLRVALAALLPIAVILAAAWFYYGESIARLF